MDDDKKFELTSGDARALSQMEEEGAVGIIMQFTDEATVEGAMLDLANAERLIKEGRATLMRSFQFDPLK